MSSRAALQNYLNFIRSINPQAADLAVARVNTLSGLAQQSDSPDQYLPTTTVESGFDFTRAIELAKEAASVLIGIEQQRRLLDINAQRAAQGLPLIDSLAAQVQVGLAPDIKNLVVIAGLFLAGIFVLRTVMGRNR